MSNKKNMSEYYADSNKNLKNMEEQQIKSKILKSNKHCKDKFINNQKQGGK